MGGGQPLFRHLLFRQPLAVPSSNKFRPRTLLASLTFLHGFQFSKFTLKSLTYRGGSKGCPRVPPSEIRPPPLPPTKPVARHKAGLHNSCIHSVATVESHSWCQITPCTHTHSINHALGFPEFLPPPGPNTDVDTPLATPNCCS